MIVNVLLLGKSCWISLVINCGFFMRECNGLVMNEWVFIMCFVKFVYCLLIWRDFRLVRVCLVLVVEEIMCLFGVCCLVWNVENKVN